MRIKTQCPIFVKTPAMYSGQYKIVIKDDQDKIFDEFVHNVTWDRMIYFRISEKRINKNLTVEITKIK